jgi:hypothetical protein
MQVIDIQQVIQLYKHDDAQKFLKVNIVIVPAPTGIGLSIRCGGQSGAHSVVVEGYYFPIQLRYYLPLRQQNDHLFCDKLNYAINPNIVKTFVKRFEHSIRNSFIDPLLTIRFDKDEIEKTREGYIPILIKGKANLGPKFEEETKAILTSGNCI